MQARHAGQRAGTLENRDQASLGMGLLLAPIHFFSSWLEPNPSPAKTGLTFEDPSFLPHVSCDCSTTCALSPNLAVKPDTAWLVDGGRCSRGPGSYWILAVTKGLNPGRLPGQLCLQVSPAVSANSGRAGKKSEENPNVGSWPDRQAELCEKARRIPDDDTPRRGGVG